MIRYVLGFAFDVNGRLALIKKNKPKWQEGKWNGIGGKLEATDHSTAHAMSREFAEETSVQIPHDQWRKVGEMIKEDWIVDVFTVKHEDVQLVRTVTDEEVRLVTCRWFERNQNLAIENVGTLIQACLIKNDVPFLRLDYSARA